MDKTIAGLLGAVGAFAIAAPGSAAPLQPPSGAAQRVSAYAELLRPVPDAVATLRAMDAVEAARPGEVIQVEDRDHHHHQRQRIIRRQAHHHHHHHDNQDRRYYR